MSIESANLLFCQGFCQLIVGITPCNTHHFNSTLKLLG